MNQKGFVNIAFIVLVVVLAGVAGYFTFVKKSQPVVQETPSISNSSSGTMQPPDTRAFIIPQELTINSDKEIEFTFSVPNNTTNSQFYINCDAGLFAYFSDNLTPRSPSPSNICNTWQMNTWDTVQPNPALLRNIRDIKIKNNTTEKKFASLEITANLNDNSVVKSTRASITINSGTTNP